MLIVGQVKHICILSRKIGSNVIAYFELVRKQQSNFTTFASMTQTLKVQDYMVLQIHISGKPLLQAKGIL